MCHLVEETGNRFELLEGTLLCDLSLIHYENLITVLQCGEAMRDRDDGGAILLLEL